jgi:tRNA 2-thiouridine synthesizing protein E
MQHPHTGHRPSHTPSVSLQVDEDGFLLDSTNWTHETSRLLAELDGLGPLGDSHWAVIAYMREHYFRFGGLPTMNRVCRKTGLKRGAVKELFGGCRRAWRIAGLANPGEEAKAYMD